jgi:hypothetical protein
MYLTPDQRAVYNEARRTNPRIRELDVFEATRNMGPVTPFAPGPAAPAAPRNPSSPSSGGRRGGGGGGGGGGDDGSAAGLRTIAGLLQMAQLIKAQDFSPLTQQVDTAYNADRGTVASSFDALDAYLNANQRNAYAEAPRAQFAQVDPGVSALAADQGANPNSVAAEGALTNARGQQGADAFNRVLQVLAAAQGAAQQSRGAESQQGRAAAMSGLSGSENAMRAAIAQRQLAAEEQARKEKLQLLAQIIPIVAQFGFNMPTNEQLGL